MMTMMMSRPWMHGLIAVIAVCAVALPATAHRVGIPVTTIEWNARSDVWEIVHRMEAHDLDPVLTTYISPAQLYETAAGLDHIDTYVRNHFVISGDISTDYIGAEKDGDFVWVYYEMRADDQVIEVSNDLLMGEGTITTALVNIETEDGVASLVFAYGDRDQSVELQRPE